MGALEDTVKNMGKDIKRGGVGGEYEPIGKNTQCSCVSMRLRKRISDERKQLI